MFDPDCNKGLTVQKLKDQENAFEKQVEEEGVYGYELQRWNKEVNVGWEHVDSCWGFVGQYSLKNSHYIVSEMINLTK